MYHMEISNSFPSILGIVGNTLLFFFAWWTAFIIPARVLLGKLVRNENPIAKLTICTSCGIALLALVAIVFGYLGVRQGVYAYIVIFGIAGFPYVKRLVPFLRSLHNQIRAIPWYVWIIVVVGIIGQNIKLAFGAFVFPKGLYLFADDMLWHLSLTSQLVRRFPPFEPGMVLEPLRNYHYLADLVPAELVRVFGLPIGATQFLFLGILYSTLIGGLMYVCAKSLKFPKAGIVVALYIAYFHSDCIYLLTVLTRRVFEFTVLPLDDGVLFLENPPKAVSFILTLTGIYFYHRFVKEKSRMLGVLATLIFGMVIAAKVHTGIMVLGGLVGVAVYFLYKKDFRNLAVPFFAFILSVALYLPVNARAGKPLFVPFELAQMFVVQERVALSFLELRRRIYLDHGNTIRVLQMNGTMLIIFLLAQFGIRNIGFFAFPILWKRWQKPIVIFFFSAITVSLVFATCFIQPIAHADIFFSYLSSFLLLGFLASYLIGSFLTKKKLYVVIPVILILGIATLPRWVSKQIDFYSLLVDRWNKHTTISRSEYDAMEFIRTQKENQGVILVLNGGLDTVQPYVTTFTSRDVFLSGQGVLRIHGISMAKREKDQSILFSGTHNEVQLLLQAYNIRIVYAYGDLPLHLALVPFTRGILFQNDSVTIYRLTHENGK